MPERPADDPIPSFASEAPADDVESESALLTRPGEPSGVDLVDEGVLRMAEQQSGLFIDLASDFDTQAGVQPGRAARGIPRVRSRWKGFGWGFWVAIGWVVFIVLLAIFANLLPLPDPNTASNSCLSVAPGAGPGAGHIFGCDDNSRDVLSRAIFGTRVSLIVGFASISIGLLVGGTLGLIAGYFRGPFDEVMNVLANTFLSFPYLVLALSVVAFLGNSLFDVTLIIAILAWPLLFRVVRASTIEYGERDYVLAARALGSTRFRVVVKQLLPDVVPSAVTYGLVGVGLAIVYEGALSFLGQSVPDPTSTWGKMIAEGSQNLTQPVAQLLVPSVAMFLTILAVNYIGDRLRGVLDTREGAL
ncbi:MAG TPA: ABC transporter permease [Acidimicrobiales bacterium]|nr:ABC transporter permease [Acidimicrobiales bacterium]